MGPEDWQRVKDVYSQALERPETERRAFVEAASDGDGELRKEVLELLASNDEADTFLGETALGEAMDLLAAAEASVMVGRRIGPWEISREIGRGGMGAVYLAERVAGDFSQKVAIKLMRGAASLDLSQRFANERRILAGLVHPNIARLIDGGTTGDGLPYFVMEYVEGIPLDQYCAENRLCVDERVDLFLTVAEAVRFAHRNLVIHRDLKPSNILVTADGTPKLLDFGIAKLWKGEEAAEVTRTALPLLTPGYASPEQIYNRPVTTASDVFTLGVVLYELLSGERPFSCGSGSLPDLARHMDSGPPTRPSSVVDEPRAQARRTTARTLRRRLRGDLDAIVLKALRGEPELRYPSVEALAQDLGNERRGLPVTARRGTFSYRAGKFVRRYRAAVVAAVLLVSSLAGGIVTTLWQARTAEAARARAERRFNDVRKLAGSLLFEYHDAVAALPGSTAARKLLVDGALEYLDSLARESGGDAELQAELATAYERVGDIQGRPDTANLGDLDAALASYRRALELRRTLAAGSGSGAYEAAIATNLHRIGNVLWWNGDTSGALEHFGESRDLRLGLVREDPEDRELRLDLAASYEAIGLVEMWNGEAQTALGTFEHALGLLRETASGPGKDDELSRRIGECLRSIGTAHGWNGDIEGAVAKIGESREILESLAEHRPDDAELGHSLVVTYLRLAEHQAELPGDAALATYLKALERIRALSEADPNNARARRVVAVTESRVGDTRLGGGDPEEALVHYLEAQEIWSSLIAEYPANASHRRDRAVTHRRIGDAHLASGRTAEAAESYEESLVLLGELAEKDAADTALLRDLALSHHVLGDALTLLADRAAAPAGRALRIRAREHFQKAFDILTDLAERGALSEYDAAEPGKVRAKIELCDRKLR